mgnify:CR=1 FL=1
MLMKGLLWILKNCPEIIDAQICKLVGTTKPTIESIRKGTHRDMANIRPKNPVAVGLCSEKDLDKALTLCRTRAENAAKKADKKTSKKNNEIYDLIQHEQKNEELNTTSISNNRLIYETIRKKAKLSIIT